MQRGDKTPAGTAGFHLHVLQDCQKYGFPCIPDIETPVVSVYYIAARWMGHTDDHSVKDMIETARMRDLIVCTIRRQPCVRLSDSTEIIMASVGNSSSWRGTSETSHSLTAPEAPFEGEPPAGASQPLHSAPASHPADDTRQHLPSRYPPL
ncbi:MAG: hypothetical protein NXI04_04415 [Planctomycetaceae bacterium]|nr:hypothetical protein [Planctomycetaceae bacterium]